MLAENQMLKKMRIPKMHNALPPSNTHGLVLSNMDVNGLPNMRKLEAMHRALGEKEKQVKSKAQQKQDKDRTSAQAKCEVYVQFMAQWKACQTQEERDALAAKLTVPTLRPILQHLNKFTSGNEEI